ncbi:response regulator transcription factor [Variovorax paradoxus]|nr:response regulator transcription factor [Variovorax paradoxus]
MSSRKGLRQRVVVLDSVLRSREHLRRAIRALGHAPLVFEALEELTPLRGMESRCSMMCLGLPPTHIDRHTWIQKARGAVGPKVPVLFLARENLLKALQTLSGVEGDSVLVAPSSFAEVYNGLGEFMAQHGIPTVDDGLTWDPYVFLPSLESVMVDGAEIRLRPLEFELALEFFHNVDRVLSRDWLRAMTSGMVTDPSGRWIDTSVARLRALLGLAPFRGSEWRLSNVRYAGYRLSRSQDKKHSKALAAASRQPQQWLESSP